MGVVFKLESFPYTPYLTPFLFDNLKCIHSVFTIYITLVAFFKKNWGNREMLADKSIKFSQNSISTRGDLRTSSPADYSPYTEEVDSSFDFAFLCFV